MSGITEQTKNKIKQILINFVQTEWQRQADSKRASLEKKANEMRQIEDLKQYLYKLY